MTSASLPRGRRCQSVNSYRQLPAVRDKAAGRRRTACTYDARMSEPLRTSRRRWIAAWAVTAAVGLVATAVLDASSTPGPRPEEPVGAVCAERIADIEKQLARAGREGDDGVLTFSRVEGGAADDCDEELRDHFGGGR